MTAALAASHVAVLLLLGFFTGRHFRYAAGVCAGQAMTEREHHWEPTDFPSRAHRIADWVLVNRQFSRTREQLRLPR